MQQARDNKGHFTKGYEGSPCTHTQRPNFYQQDYREKFKVDDNVKLDKDPRVHNPSHYDYQKKPHEDKILNVKQQQHLRPKINVPQHNVNDGQLVVRALILKLAEIIKGVDIDDIKE